jgi:uncharacterized protein (TIGR00369 family)
VGCTPARAIHATADPASTGSRGEDQPDPVWPRYRLLVVSTRDPSESVRRGPFWDALEGRREPPPAAMLLGWELVTVDPEEGTIKVAFTATEQFTNPAGHIQGGFLAAMLDDTLGPALVATLDDGEWAPTIDLHVQFLAPAQPGRLIGRGRITRRGRDIAFLSGDLSSDSTIVATAMAVAAIRRVAS